MLRLLRDSFESPLEAKLVERLWDSNAIISERIVEDGAVIAYAAITEVSIGAGDNKHAYGEGLALAPVATASGRRREGYGSAVVRAAINAAFNAFPDRPLFVLGDPAYYWRFGFIPAAPFGYLWEGGDVGDAFQMLRNDRKAAPFKSGAPDSGASDAWASVFYHKAFSVFGEES